MLTKGCVPRKTAPSIAPGATGDDRGSARRAMKALVIGGTGLISGGVVKHLLARGAEVHVYSRRQHGTEARAAGERDTRDTGGPFVRFIRGDRSDARAFVAAFASSRYDVVIDMICFSPADATATVAAFGGRCEQLQFCSTVCTYGVDVPPRVLIDETCPQTPPTLYGQNKVLCERIFERAHADRAFKSTIIRPSQTYGPGGTIIDQLEIDGGTTWDRIVKGQPVLCTGDGLGLWQATHRDDVGELFAYAALNPATYGEAYNATRERVFTWRDYYREAARALDRPAKLVFVPAAWLLSAATCDRFGLLRDVTRFHGAYSSAKARAHVPEFRATVDFERGARETFGELRRRGAWRDSAADLEYERLVNAALAFGFPVEEA
ncbi:MAG TPA: NAD-dependent epimerase/dehydratase family protein [Polyangiaceae bacterium]